MGINPNERDSDGVTPLGRINDHLRNLEKLKSQQPAVAEAAKPQLISAAENLIFLGADPTGILPLPRSMRLIA